jgi:hypothetical protein
MPFDHSIDYSTDRGRARLLINDTDEDPVFSDEEIDVFLALEGGSVKLAAAQALDTIADDEALTSKAIRSQDLSTNGPSVAAGLRARAKELRTQSGSGSSLAPVGAFPDAPGWEPWR